MGAGVGAVWPQLATVAVASNTGRGAQWATHAVPKTPPEAFIHADVLCCCAGLELLCLPKRWPGLVPALHLLGSCAAPLLSS